MSRSVTVPRRARRVEEQQQPTTEQQQHCVPDSRDSDSGAAARCRRGRRAWRRGRLEGRPADPAGAAAACAPRPRGVVLRVCSSVWLVRSLWPLASGPLVSVASAATLAVAAYIKARPATRRPRPGDAAGAVARVAVSLQPSSRVPIGDRDTKCETGAKRHITDDKTLLMYGLCHGFPVSGFRGSRSGELPRHSPVRVTTGSRL